MVLRVVVVLWVVVFAGGDVDIGLRGGGGLRGSGGDDSGLAGGGSGGSLAGGGGDGGGLAGSGESALMGGGGLAGVASRSISEDVRLSIVVFCVGVWVLSEVLWWVVIGGHVERL